MFRLISKMIKGSCICYCSRNRCRMALLYQQQNYSKIKKKYINLCDHQNSAIVADTGSPITNDIRIFFQSAALKIFSFEIIIIKKKSPVTASRASRIFDYF